MLERMVSRTLITNNIFSLINGRHSPLKSNLIQLNLTIWAVVVILFVQIFNVKKLLIGALGFSRFMILDFFYQIWLSIQFFNLAKLLISVYNKLVWHDLSL